MTYDLAVVGGGPAGVAAAVAAADRGLSVVLVDAGPRVGGQYFRTPSARLSPERPGGSHGWREFTRLRERLAGHKRITHLAGHRVWMLEDGHRVLHLLDSERDGRAVTVRARGLVIAAGAHDRSIPFPGWDLPGVMTAGGAQALLKGNLLRAGERVVVAGSGPFLLPVATGLAAAGAKVAGVYEANRPTRFLASPRTLAANPGRLAEAAGYAAALLRHGIPYRTGRAVIAAHGDDAVEAVTVARLDRQWRPIPGTERRIGCDALAVGYGFTPQLELPLHLGCATRLDADGSLVVTVDAAQRTSVEHVWAAGETTGIGGARLALIEGELAGRAAATTLIHPPTPTRRKRGAAAEHAADSARAVDEAPGSAGAVTDGDGLAHGGDSAGGLGGVTGLAGAATDGGGSARAVGEASGLADVAGEGDGSEHGGGSADGVGEKGLGRLVRRRGRSAGFAEVLKRVYGMPGGWAGWLGAETIVCRCERVPYGRLVAARELGAADARAVKLLTRAGMGRCQGRVCGYAVACLAGRPHDQEGLAKRIIAQPVRLGELARQTEEDTDE